MESRYPFRRLNEVVGLFVLVCLAAVIVALVFTARAQRWFERQYPLLVLLPEDGAFGLREGSEVWVFGVSAGWVDAILVQPDGRLVARAKIRGELRPLVRVDSTATIARAFAVAGESHLEIGGGQGAPLPNEAAFLHAEAPDEWLEQLTGMLSGAGDELSRTAGTARTAMEEWRQLGAGLARSQEQLSRTILRVDQLVSDVQRGEGTVGQLLADPSLAQEMLHLLEQGSRAMTNLQATLRNLQAGTERLPQVGERLAGGTEDLPALMLQAQQTIREIEIFFDGLQRHWLVRGYMDPSTPRPRIPPQRFEGGSP
jgi:phospholipid/cholesterol/gamma-HCH transport system substrate-binding protein